MDHKCTIVVGPRQHAKSASNSAFNCQVGVFAAYVSRHGHALIDRALYLPKAWTDDRPRLEQAHVPATATFPTKPQMAATINVPAIAADVPFAWVAADTVYGLGAIEMALRRAGKATCLA